MSLAEHFLGLSTLTVVQPHCFPLAPGDSQLIRSDFAVAALNGAQISSPKSLPIIFQLDVDGVLTNPVEKVVNTSLIQNLVGHLQQGHIVALNSGRALPWILENVVGPLAHSVNERSVLRNFLVLGEKGATWLEYDEPDGFRQYLDPSCRVPEIVRAEVRQLVERISPCVVQFDEQKQAMCSLEFVARRGENPQTDFVLFEDIQGTLAGELREVLRTHGLEQEFRVDATRIAIDIEHHSADKAKGSRHLLDWCERRRIQPQHVVTVGDSQSDVQMAVAIQQRGIPVTHVHVGDGNDFAGTRLSVDVEATGEKFDLGTLELLDSTRALLETPETSAELLQRFHRYSRFVECCARWYDRVFLAASRVEFDHARGQVRVELDPSGALVKLKGFTAPGSIPLVSDLSTNFTAGQVQRLSVTEQKEIIAGQGAILVSSGLIILRATQTGDVEMLTLKRSNDAPVAPGEIQSSAGRLDKAFGASAYQECAEEHLLVARKDGQVCLLGVKSETFLSDHKVVSTILSAREKAIADLHRRLHDTQLRNDGGSGEIEKISKRIALLESVEKVVLLDRLPVSSVLNGVPLTAVSTCLGAREIESVDEMFVVYQENTNTLEARKVVALDWNGYEIIDLIDGDGFNRTVAFRGLPELLSSGDPIHWPTRMFLEAAQKSRN